MPNPETKDMPNSDPTDRDLAMRALRGCDDQADRIRAELGLNRRHELVWAAAVDADKKVEVEADGYGGFTVYYRQDGGGCDVLNLRDPVSCGTEDEATALAAEWAGIEEDD
jgi:hypothetical protein